MALIILNSQHTSNSKNITANYIKVNINNEEIEFPQFCASFSDYTKADKARIQLKSKIFQYHINLVKYDNITTEKRQGKLLKNYRHIQKKHSPILSDVNFWWDGHIWTEKEREAALELQTKMNTDFLSDVIVDRDHITQGQFESQVNDLLSRNTNKIKCPSISMNTDEQRFSDLLQVIENKNIQRFNVDWTGLSKYRNWITLSSFLKNKKIWCNMTAINERRHRTTKKSYVMLGIAHGVHTAGLGYPAGFNPDEAYVPKSYMLDQTSFHYNQVDDSHSDICDTVSHNRLSGRILEAQNHIKNDTFYNKFLPEDFMP